MSTRLENYFQLEEMIQLLIRIVGKSNEKIMNLEEKLKKLEDIVIESGEGNIQNK
jgi:hypothetical protein